MRALTTTDMIGDVRVRIDEDNVKSATNDAILRMLSQGVERALRKAVRLHPDGLISHAALTLVANQAEYLIPEYVYEDYILRIEVDFGDGNFSEVEQRDFGNAIAFEGANPVEAPLVWRQSGQHIEFVPAPTGTYNARFWYVEDIPPLVLPEGRVTKVNNTGNYCFLDWGEETTIDTTSDSNESYVSIIDGQTGRIKGSLQVNAIEDAKVTFRPVPVESAVLNKPISGLTTEVSLEKNDYLCNVSGTCMPLMKKTIYQYAVQYAVTMLMPKASGNYEVELAILGEFEKDLGSSLWGGRRKTVRIRDKARAWNKGTAYQIETSRRR